MRQVNETVYNADELVGKAQERAYYEWLESAPYAWGDDNKKTLKEFESIFPIRVDHWEYDSYNGHVRFTFTEDECIEEVEGFRLAKYIWNNYKRHLFKGRYYSLWSKKDINPYYREGGSAPKGALKSRYSKIMLTTGGVLTGYCMDDDMLNPIYKFLEKPVPGYTFNQLMRDCLDAWVNSCVKDYDYCTSMEYFIENSNINNYEYCKNGNFYS